MVADETTGYSAGGSDQGLRTRVGARPIGHGSTGFGEASNLSGEGRGLVLELTSILWSWAALVYRKRDTI